MEKEKVTFRNILYYIQGNISYRLYYSKCKKIIPLHIREQIEMRIRSMNKECYNKGACIKCGCQTTHLQMCSKPCKGGCYPKMMNKKDWELTKRLKGTFDCEFEIVDNKFKKV